MCCCGLSSEAIAINQDKSFSAADRISNRSTGAQVWTRPLSNGDLALVFYNSHNLLPARVSVSWEELHVPAPASLHVRDIWAATNDAPAVGSLSATIKPRDVKFMRLSQAGSDHLSEQQQQQQGEDKARRGQG